MGKKKTSMFKQSSKPAGPKREHVAQSPARAKGVAKATAVQQVDDMTIEQQQAAEQYLQFTAMLAKRLVDQGIVKRSPGSGIQAYVGAYNYIEECINEVIDLLVRKLNKPFVPEITAALSGMIGKVIGEAAQRGVKQEVTEDMFNSLEKMFGAGVRLTTMEALRAIESPIVRPNAAHIKGLQ